MENYKVSKSSASSFHVEGFPNAVKLIALDDPRSRRLSDLALHRSDLDFAERCLDGINQIAGRPFVIHELAKWGPFNFFKPQSASSHQFRDFVREVLWRSAVIHFFKCFGDAGVRFQLSAERILKGEPPEAMMNYNHFKSLRNKHYVHDESAYTQSIPGAVLNTPGKERKIEKVLCFSASAEGLNQGNFSNLKLLIQKSRAWVIQEFDKLCDDVMANLEREPYEKLFSRESVQYKVPTTNEVHQNRR